MKIPTLLLPLVLMTAAAAFAAAETEPPVMDLPALHKTTALSLAEMLCLPHHENPVARSQKEKAEAAALRQKAPHACSSTCVRDVAGRYVPVRQGSSADFLLSARRADWRR